MIGRTLGHYRIEEKLGEGGMGEVYRAVNENLGSDVALKVLPTGKVTDETARSRFRKEALTLSKLSHPYIAAIHDFASHDGTDFLVMEYVAGETLADKLRDRPLELKEIVRLGGQIAEALEEAHDHGIIHRDLKPRNIALTHKGHAKVLDFGIAKLVRSTEEKAEAVTVDTLTKTVGMSGTLPYMAPEQLRGGAIDTRTDIWAFGIVLFEMATGQRPFREKDPARLMQSILADAPDMPTMDYASMSPGLGQVIFKCLEKDPDNRYQHASEVAVDLRRLQRDTDSLGSEASPGRMPRGSGRRVPGHSASWVRWVIGAVVALAIVVGGYYWQSRTAQALTEEDFILLTDFVNKTGDEIFDGTLKAGLSVKLEESPFLNVFPQQRVRRTLELMERPPDEPVTEEIGLEICQRENIKALVLSEIAPLGDHYVLTLNAVNCQTGDSLARVQAEAENKEAVLAKLGEASSSLREKLGESVASLEEFDTPLLAATTSSLEAFKAYAHAVEAIRSGRIRETVLFASRAVALDPNFASAHGALGWAYVNLGERETSVLHFTKAFELRGRASEQERLLIVSTYYRQVTGEIEKSIETLEVLMRTYPRQEVGMFLLAVYYRSIGQHEKALDNFIEAVKLLPGRVTPLLNLAWTYQTLGRYPEARATLERMIAEGLETPGVHSMLYTIASLEGDTATMEALLAESRGGPTEKLLLLYESSMALSGGRFREARELLKEAETLYELVGEGKTIRPILEEFASLEAMLGNHERALAMTEEAMIPSPADDLSPYFLLTLARVGEIDRAVPIAEEMARRHPSNTMLHRGWLPNFRGAVELTRGNPAGAIEALKAAEYTSMGWDLGPITPFLRGQAYIALGDGPAAAAEYQKIVDHPGVWPTEPYHSLAHLGQARAYAMMGEIDKSRGAYEEFFELWKDADPDIPILIEAQAEYAKLE